MPAGEILELKYTVNTMVDQLCSFADEVTRVAREVGTEGTLGGQAQVRGVAGTWRDLTENVNQLASTLTTQLRAISAVSTAVASGDLTQQIPVAALGEVAELKDNINQMIAALRDTTAANAEQGWLDSNLARIGGLLQGQRDLGEVCSDDHGRGRAAGGRPGRRLLPGRPSRRPTRGAGRGHAQRLVMCAGYAVVPASADGDRRRSGSARAWSGRRRGRAPGARGRRPARLPADPLRGRRDAAAARWSCSPSCSRASRSA